MMIARHSTSSIETDIEGDFQSLLQLSKILISKIQDSAIELESVIPSPYELCLNRIEIQKITGEDSKISISRDDRVLTIRGSSKYLELLAQNIRFLVSQSADPKSMIQDHIHEEYYENHPYISVDSIPITVTIKTATAG